MRKRNGADSGFTLLEVLVVLVIIGTMAAVAIPSVMTYLQFYRIRGASQQVAGAIQAARLKAIGKSSNYGTVFVIQNPTTYWVHLEDLQPGVVGANFRGGPGCAAQGATSGALDRQCLDPLIVAPNPQSTRYVLPDRVVFAATAECITTPPVAAPGFNPSDGQIRFNRLGSACDPGYSPNCPLATLAGGLATTPLIDNRVTDSMICLSLRGLNNLPTGIARTIRISRGGQVEEQR